MPMDEVKKKVAVQLHLPDNVQQIHEILRVEGERIDRVKAEERQEPVSKEKELRDQIADAERKQKLMPNVVVEDDGQIDTLRDTKWVYQNIGRLIVRNELGLEQLNEDVLVDAPSNGAIGLAHYCLNDRKAFFEKFVIKILPKDDGSDETEPSEEELALEHDPSFAGLEQYLQKIEEDEG